MKLVVNTPQGDITIIADESVKPGWARVVQRWRTAHVPLKTFEEIAAELGLEKKKL